MSLRRIEGELCAAGKRYAIVAARWNEIFSARLVEGAVDAIVRHGGCEENITVVRVPGCFEIPVTVRELVKQGNCDAVIAVGVLIKGETDHYQLIANELVSGLLAAMNESGVPVCFGVVTANDMEQAMARAGAKAGNKGWEAAVAAIEMTSVMAELRGGVPASAK